MGRSQSGATVECESQVGVCSSAARREFRVGLCRAWLM